MHNSAMHFKINLAAAKFTVCFEGSWILIAKPLKLNYRKSVAITMRSGVSVDGDILAKLT